MSEFLSELGYSPLRYWLFAGCAFLLWFASAILPWNSTGKPLSRVNRPIVFGLLLLVAMFAWGWPAIFYYKPVNPDESQFIAGALTTIAQRDIWWNDSMTSGPLVVLPLAIPALAGLPLDFISARFIGLFLSWGTILLSYLALRHIHGEQKARLLVMPLACLMIFLLFWDFAPYSSERAPLFLCALAAWLCLTAFDSAGVAFNRIRLIAGGFVLGLLPFSKFQVIPMGVAIGLSTLCWILNQPLTEWSKVQKDIRCLFGGIIAAFGLVVLSAWLSGHWAEVYKAYFLHNLYYTLARGLPWRDSGYVLSYLTNFSWGFYSFHCGILLLLAIAQWGFKQSSWRPLLLGWSLVIMSYCAVLIPGRLYPHYLLFLSLPLVLLTGLQFGYLLNGKSRRTYLILVGLFLSIGIGAQLFDRISDPHSLHSLIAVRNSRSTVVDFLNLAKKSGDKLVVWGWRPELYVETQLPQGTREALTEAQLNPSSQREHFRERFMRDMHTNRPAFFIDSVGPDDFILKNKLLQSHESMPGLGAYIDEHYTEVSLVDSFRVYVRRDRLKEID